MVATGITSGAPVEALLGSEDEEDDWAVEEDEVEESEKFEAKGCEEWPETSSKLVELESGSPSGALAWIVIFRHGANDDLPGAYALGGCRNDCLKASKDVVRMSVD